MALGSTIHFRVDPVLNHNFIITLLDTSSALGAVGTAALAGLTQVALGGFTECSGLDMALDVEDYKEGGNNGTGLKFPTRVTWPNITLKSGLGISEELWWWQYSFALGKAPRRDGLIVLMNNFHIPHNIWYFRRGLPVKYTGPSMNAGQSGVAIQQMDIAHEGIFHVPGVAAAATITQNAIDAAAR